MIENILDTINLQQLGKQLQLARSNKGMRQEDVADLLGVARTTVTAIEKGDRKLKASELIKLARAYGKQVSDFLQKTTKIESFEVQFRGPVHVPEHERQQIQSSINNFQQLVQNYYDLEQITNNPLIKNYPEQYPYKDIPIEIAAETISSKERGRLGLGDGPVANIHELLEEEVGIRIFYIDMPGLYSAIYHYDKYSGASIAVNSKHPRERQLMSIVHDYGHFLSDREKPTTLMEGSRNKPISEKFADEFAIHFLLPREGVLRRYADYLKKGSFTPADLCTMAHYYGVSVEALALRLEDMQIMRSGTWEKLKKQGLKVREVQRHLGLESAPKKQMLPTRYTYLALRALENEDITESQFASYMFIDIVESRVIASKLREESEGVLSQKGNIGIE